jgi:hypothetical protein
MSYLTKVYDQLRAARADIPADALRVLEGRIMDEHRPAVATIAVGSDKRAPVPAPHQAKPAAGQALDHARTRDWVRNIAGRVPERTGPTTTGVRVTPDGTQVEVISGHDPESDRAELTLLDSPHFPRVPVRGGGLGVADHVETKIAQRMRDQGTPYAAVVLDNRVCDGRWGCEFAVPAILPLGYTLLVWQPGAERPLTLRGKARP